MITYQSTRGDKKEYTFSQAILKGIAPDGGLLIPQKIPRLNLDNIKNLQNKSYQDIALFIMKLLETDFADSVLRRLINKAYGDNFDHSEIAPLIHLKNNQYALELWHGPTSAFKDMALQFMPLLFSQALKINKTPDKYLILVATSGDTGAAALEGYKNKENINIIALFPDGGVSTIQELTMSTFSAESARVLAINGDFDDAQSLVKEIFNDKNFNQILFSKYNILLSAANSINWGRLVPQLVYYLSSYVNLLKNNRIKLGDKIDVAVPSGNLGNVFAAYFMKKIGLPVRNIICASNSNNVLTKFFQTGKIDISDQKIIETPSPSMNVLIPSNLERLLYTVTQDSTTTKKWMTDLKKYKKFEIDSSTKKTLKEFIFADWVDNKDTLKCINQTLEKTGYLLDPHTAVAMEAANRYKKQFPDNTPIIICATAHWSKFPEDTYKALFGISSEKDIFKIFSRITNKLPNAQIPQNILALQKKQINNIPILPPDKKPIQQAITDFLSHN